jgi:hypothetical protein
MRTETKIIIGLFLIVVIFCLFYGKSSKLIINKEGFTDPTPSNAPGDVPVDIDTLDATARNLNIFTNALSSADKSTMTPEQLDELYKNMTNEIKTLNSTIYNLALQISQNRNNAINNQENVKYETQTNLADTADIKASQLVQDAYIQRLTERLAKLQSVYDSYLKNKNHKSYPKIPVYSSCVVSEASGSYSVENTNNNLTNNKPEVSYGQKVVPSVQQYNPLKEIKTAENMTFDDVINGLAQNEININFTA